MNDDIHTVTFRLIDGNTEQRQMTTGELLDLNAAWMSPDKPEDDEPDAA